MTRHRNQSAATEMSGIDARRIALVVAQLNGASDVVATGYFISANLVLTVRHVAQGQGSTFLVRADVKGDRWSEATPVWNGVADVDAILLRTDKRFGDWTVPLFRPVTEGGSWESSGYAELTANEDSGDRKTQPIDGDFNLSLGQGPPALALRTNQNIAAGEWDTYWKGVSGAPIFRKPEGEIIGLVVEANRAMTNALIGMPIARVLDDINFRSAITPSFLGDLPSAPWCLVLTSERLGGSLVAEVAGVLSGFRNEALFEALHEDPIELPVVDAVRSVENWAAAVDALAKADYVIADVTNFEPAVILLLGVRSVLRRGVTISVTRDKLETHTSATPFNVRETRVLSYSDHGFYNHLHLAMTDGAASLAEDPNYLDLPAYHGVRSPRSETWAKKDSSSVLVLCSFSESYDEFFDRLHPIISSHTRNLSPLRMKDLRSPRLVGQALYERIRWATRCIADWSEWRPNVFFELGVRLACSENDPLSIIEQRDAVNDFADGLPDDGYLHQQKFLQKLFSPVRYDRDDPRVALKSPLDSWRRTPAGSAWQVSEGAIPPAGTFSVAQLSFVWQDDAMLTAPHVEQRSGAERIFGKNQNKEPERLILFSKNVDFEAELGDAVRERWIAAWLYLQHLSSADEGKLDDALRSELVVIGSLASGALESSPEARHVKLRQDIEEFLGPERSRRRAKKRI